MKNSILVFLICCLSILGNSQDLSHYTFYQLAPSTLNPGLIGAFEGTFRIGGLFRGQLNDANRGYRQPTFAIDAPVIKGLREKDWVGFGISTDIWESAGDSYFQQGGSHLGLSYHFALDDKRDRVLSIGIQYGSISNKIDSRAIPVTGATIESGEYDVLDGDLNTVGVNFNQTDNNYQGEKSGGNMNIGVSFRALLNKNSTFKGGIMLAHLLAPRLDFANSGERLRKRIAAYGQFTSYINKNLRIEPSLFAQFQGPARSVQLQCMAGLLLDPAKNMVVNAGLGYRLEGSAAEFLFSIEQGNLTAGLSFDLPLTGAARAPGLQNAFEFGFGYIFKISKRPDVKPVIFCPRL